MNIFVIHRFENRKKVKKHLKQMVKTSDMQIQWVFLDSINTKWEVKARRQIHNAEAVIVYDYDKCQESDNCKMEIAYAEKLKKEIIYFEGAENNEDAINKLVQEYNFVNEFNQCFSSDDDNSFSLYKLMLETSEELIARRQRTNTFFITVLGTIITIAGILIKSGIEDKFSSIVILLLSFISIILCISWYKLINNYGKLNKAKFTVINRLEEDFKNRIFTAEWIALGKGLRKRKYQSFTDTEKNLPIYFVIIITAANLIYFYLKYGCIL